MTVVTGTGSASGSASVSGVGVAAIVAAGSASGTSTASGTLSAVAAFKGASQGTSTAKATANITKIGGFNQAFPNLQMPFLDARGNLTPISRAFLSNLWIRSGSDQAAQNAFVSGAKGQPFNVGFATEDAHATPRAQVSSMISGTVSAAGGDVTSILVGTSPFVYTVRNRGSVNISGGTVSNVTLKRGASTLSVPVSGLIPVASGDVLTVTYTAAPTMSLVPF